MAKLTAKEIKSIWTAYAGSNASLDDTMQRAVDALGDPAKQTEMVLTLTAKAFDDGDTTRLALVYDYARLHGCPSSRNILKLVKATWQGVKVSTDKDKDRTAFYTSKREGVKKVRTPLNNAIRAFKQDNVSIRVPEMARAINPVEKKEKTNEQKMYDIAFRIYKTEGLDIARITALYLDIEKANKPAPVEENTVDTMTGCEVVKAA